MNRVLVTGLIHGLDLVGGSAVQLGRSAASAGHGGQVHVRGHSRRPPPHPSLARRQRSTGAIDSRLWSRGCRPRRLLVARQLARTHRVIIPDLLWFGGSTSDAQPSLGHSSGGHPSTHRSLVFVDESVHIVGSSYGGFVALRYGSCPFTARTARYPGFTRTLLRLRTRPRPSNDLK